MTAEPAAAAHFYSATLGLAEQFRDGEHWVQFRAGAVSFALATPEEVNLPPGGTVAVFEVVDLDAAIARAVAAGGRLCQRRDMGAHGHMALLSDAAGATVALIAMPLAPAANSDEGKASP